eukprot:112944_1
MPRSNGRTNCSQIQLVLFLVLLSTTMVLVMSSYSRKMSVPVFQRLRWMGYRSRRTIPIRQCGLNGIRQREGLRELVGAEVHSGFTGVMKVELGPNGEVIRSGCKTRVEINEENDNRIGRVTLRNTQRKVPVEKEKLEYLTYRAMEVLGCKAWDVSIWLTTDTVVRKLNSRYRQKPKSTDILSFPLHEQKGAPGTLPEVLFAEEMELGEMVISMPYVQRQCKRDILSRAKGEIEEDDRGVSGAMAKLTTANERLPLLMIHGLLHLVGYDHETDEGYEDMVRMEEMLLNRLSLG